MSKSVCFCTFEPGDTDCPKHPTCPECGAELVSTTVAARMITLENALRDLLGCLSISDGVPGTAMRGVWCAGMVDHAAVAIRANDALGGQNFARRRLADNTMVVRNPRGQEPDEECSDCRMKGLCACPEVRP